MGSIPEELLLARIKREQEAREAAIAALEAQLANATDAVDQKILSAASKLTTSAGGRTVSSSAIAGLILRTQVEPGFASAEEVTLLQAKVTDGQNTSAASIEELRTVTATQFESIAQQTLTIRAQFNGNIAQVREQITAQANATSASASRITTLEASVNNPTTGVVAAHARITTEESVRVTQTTALATRATSLEATVNNPTTGVAAAHSRITTEETARATAVEAVATRATSLEATVNNPTTGVAASHARITAEETARATAVEAVATRATTLEATVNNPTTGVAASHARITAEETARATAVSAVTTRTSALEATVNSQTGGVVAAHSRITTEETARATADTAQASRITTLESTVNDPATGVAAAHSRISTEETTRSTAVSAVASRTTALEASVNHSTTGLGATYARILAEESARANADEALTTTISGVSATTNLKNRTFFQTTQPTGTAVGDLWINSSTGAVKRWDGSSWSDTQIANGAITAAVAVETNARTTAVDALTSRTTTLESTVNNATTGLSATRGRVQTIENTYATQSFAEAKKTEAITAAAGDATAKVGVEAQARADADTALSTSISTVSSNVSGKNKTFLQAGIPTASAIGDLWIDTGNGNAIKRWDGSAWQDANVASGAIGAAVSAEATARSTADGHLSGKYTLTVGAGNVVTGMTITSSTGAGTPVSDVTFSAQSFKIYNTGTGSAVAPFQVVGNQVRVTGALVLTSGDISGLGSLATANSVAAGQVSGLGSLATQNSVAAGQVSGLGSLATASSVDLSTQVTNKSLANLDSAADTKLDGIAAGADVTLQAINGGLTITSGGITLAGLPLIKSSNYSPGISGWAIKGNGDVEFDNGVFRGTVRAARIDYAPLIGAAGPGASAVMDFEHSGGYNWRTDINDSNAAFRIFNSNAPSGTKIVELGVGSYQLDKVKVWGDIETTGYGYGDFTSYSSRSLKENVISIGPVMEKLLKVAAVEFDWKKGAAKSGHDFGVIAEDIEQLFPMVVVRDKEGVPAVNYAKLTVYLLKAVQEIAAKI